MQVFGPYDGSLDNGGESIKLYKPGKPEPDGFVPRILVDRVKILESSTTWNMDNPREKTLRMNCMSEV